MRTSHTEGEATVSNAIAVKTSVRFLMFIFILPFCIGADRRDLYLEIYFGPQLVDICSVILETIS
jgi:hypothetical protein